MESIPHSMESILKNVESIPHLMESILKKYGVHPPFHGKSMESIPHSMESIHQKYGIHPPFHGIHPLWQQGPASFNITAKTDVCTLPINVPKLIIVYVTYYCLKLSNISTIMASTANTVLCPLPSCVPDITITKYHFPT